MSRTLIASPSSATSYTPKTSPDQTETLAIVWSCVCELWLMGARHAQIAPKRLILERQLHDPALQDHPKRGAALTRHRTWSAEIEGIERRAGPLVANLAKHHGLLTVRNRTALIANPGWSQLQDGKAFAEEMWERARAQAPWPVGEAPFDLAPLPTRATGQGQKGASDDLGDVG